MSETNETRILILGLYRGLALAVCNQGKSQVETEREWVKCVLVEMTFSKASVYLDAEEKTDKAER